MFSKKSSLSVSNRKSNRKRCLNHILKYPVLDRKITPAPGAVQEAGGQVTTFGFHLKTEDSFGISMTVCDLERESHLI